MISRAKNMKLLERSDFKFKVRKGLIFTCCIEELPTVFKTKFFMNHTSRNAFRTLLTVKFTGLWIWG